MRIVITGSPGTGKSLIARALAKKRNCPLIDIKKIVKTHGLKERGAQVDIKKLARALAFLKKEKSYVVEGHLACEIKIPADFIIVLRTNPAILEKRLAKRGYGKRKLTENLEAEMLDYCVQRAEKEYNIRPLELDTSRRSVRGCVLKIQNAIRKKRKRIDRVDYSRQLAKRLGLHRE